MTKFTCFKLFAILFLLLLSCKKEEEQHSCFDGVQSPGELGVDCGGVCPPCAGNDNPAELLLVTIRGNNYQFSNKSFEYYDDWVLNFQNDSINVNLNFGSMSEPGLFPIKPAYSSAMIGFNLYDDFVQGQLLLTQKDNLTNRVSGYFEARIVGHFFDSLMVDTLFIQNGDFSNLKLD